MQHKEHDYDSHVSSKTFLYTGLELETKQETLLFAGNLVTVTFPRCVRD